MTPLVKRLTGVILDESLKRGWTKEELAAEANRLAKLNGDKDSSTNASTWYGWRDGRRSPKVEDLEKFANAVQLRVGLIPYGVVAATGDFTVVDNSTPGGGTSMDIHTRRVIELMAGLSEHEKLQVLEAVAIKRHEIANPPGRDAEPELPRQPALK